VLLIVQKSAVSSVPTTTVLAYGRSWAAVASPPFEAEPPVAATIAPAGEQAARVEGHCAVGGDDIRKRGDGVERAVRAQPDDPVVRKVAVNGALHETGAARGCLASDLLTALVGERPP
jgi:hypothetical protein